MKKSIIIILAVAVIGSLGVYSKSHSHPQVSSAPATVQGDSTTGSAQMSEAGGLSAYKDGTYTGSTENTVYGPVEISVVISGGKITDVKFLRMPDDRGHTQEVTAFAQPILKDETLRQQSAHLDFVSGATQTSEGYMQSLQSALDQAA